MPAIKAAIDAALAQAVDAENKLRQVVEEARAAGATWADIGDALGVSRQAVYKRFGKPNNKENEHGTT
jgi:DNA invertase Pin-like site-specific DNA recombinase